MSTVSTAIRFTPEEKKWIQGYATFSNRSFSDVVREAVFEKLENELDALDLAEAIRSDDGVSYSLEESMRLNGVSA